MAHVSKSRPGPERLGFVALPGGAGSSGTPAAPRPPAHLGLRRAAEIVEGAAFDLAGSVSPVFISRLIEIAAELERHARSRLDEAAFAGGTVTVLRRD